MELKSYKDKVSYIVGEDMAKSIMKEDIELDVDILLTAIKETFSGKTSNTMTDEEKNSVMQQLAQEMQEKQATRNAQQAMEEKRKGREFLENNRKQPNVIETPSGLQYTVLQEGKGKKPTANDTVKVHYHGTLLNGTIFDSSIRRGEPISFPLNGVIAGWTEGVQLMSVGSKYRFYIPSELAYGDQPVGNIPAGSTLIFEVELLDIE